MKTDLQLQQDVMDELNWDPAVHAALIGVEVKGGDVTLTGTVHSWAERDLATRTAWGSAGVRNVVDRIELVD